MPPRRPRARATPLITSPEPEPSSPGLGTSQDSLGLGDVSGADEPLPSDDGGDVGVNDPDATPKSPEATLSPINYFFDKTGPLKNFCKECK